ncbi:MAG: manganese efflux pump MntP family protein [Lachnospiraceae bacterium]|nr:manganese efflux pump MntP family protein [Lachnospiraceae bacterium]
MSIWEIFLIGLGLSMDAFAVSICKGLSLRRITVGPALAAGLWFGGFQALMPVLGWLLGAGFSSYIEAVDHWIVFALLLFIGANMIREALSEKEGNESASSENDRDFSPKAMFPLAVATSIDALAVGVSFAFLHTPILLPAFLIGTTTFVFGALGICIGSVFGSRFKGAAEICGGCVLILIGSRILLQHLGLL